LVDGCNVIMLPDISANQIDSEDSGGEQGQLGSESLVNWWGIPSQKSRQGQQHKERECLNLKNILRRGLWH